MSGTRSGGRRLADDDDDGALPPSFARRGEVESEDSNGVLAPPVPGQSKQKPATAVASAKRDMTAPESTEAKLPKKEFGDAAQTQEDRIRNKELACAPTVSPPARPSSVVSSAAPLNSSTDPQQQGDMDVKAAARAITTQGGQRIGAVAVSPTPMAVTATDADMEEEHNKPPEEENMTGDSKPAATSIEDPAAALNAELVTDVEAQVQERVRQERDDIAAEVQRRIIDQAVHADVMEDTTPKGTPPPESSCNWKLWGIVGLVIAVLVILGVVLGVVLGGGDGGSSKDLPTEAPASPTVPGTPVPTPVPTLPPTEAPTAAPTGRIDILRERLEVEFGEIMPNTPQAETLAWLSETDPLQLPEEVPFRILKERYVIALLHFATNGVNWSEQFGFLGESSVCSWNDGRGSFSGAGVFCDANDSVTHIVIETNNLVGTLIGEFTALASMEKVDLDENSLVGPIPEAIGNLTELEWFTVGSNDLSGAIPSALFELPRLETLFLSGNKRITGSIPANIGNAPRMKILSLFECTGLSGSIPPSITDMSSLERLSLVGVSLTGPVPAFTSPSLTFLALEQNALTGEIPASLGSLPNLAILSLSDNFLNGTIPSMSGSPSLTTFWVFENQLTGNIETLLTSVEPTGLVELDVGVNRLTGTIPTLIGQLTDLQDLRLNGNRFTGTIPSELGLVLGLNQFLNLFDNDLEGAIPSEIGLLTDIQLLDVGVNKLNSSIPVEIGSLMNALGIGVQDNELTGIVPTEIAAIPNLVQLLVAKNNFEGSLDPFFCARVGDPIATFHADCLGNPPEIECSCCTTCCRDAGGTCEQLQ